MIKIKIIYATKSDQIYYKLECKKNITVQEAIQNSGIFKKYPHLRLSQCKVGIYNEIVNLKQFVKNNDRIEIYRPLLINITDYKKMILHKK